MDIIYCDVIVIVSYWVINVFAGDMADVEVVRIDEWSDDDNDDGVDDDDKEEKNVKKMDEKNEIGLKNWLILS